MTHGTRPDESFEWRGFLLAAAILSVPVWWGAAGSFPWDVDNIAPGPVLRGLSRGFAPSWWSSYGPVPYLVSALPVALGLAWFKLTGEWHHAAAEYPHGFDHPEASLAALAILARLATVVLAALVVAVSIRAARREGHGRTAWLAVPVLLGSATFAYYARTSNVDVHFLFWLWLGFEFVERGRGLRDAAIAASCAAWAICSKEQSSPLALSILVAACWLAWRNGGSHPMRVAVPLVAAAAAYALVWRLPFGADAWLEHHRFLVESARYPRSFDTTGAGWAALAQHVVRLLPIAIGWPALLVTALALALRTSWRGLEWRLLGVAMYLVGFIGAIGYCYPRFLLPVLLVCVPLAPRIGSGLVARPRRAALWIVLLIAALPGAPLLTIVQLDDPRYRAESWLRSQERHGTHIEVAGNRHFHPRIPEGTSLTWTRLDSLRNEPRGPVGAIVLVSSLDRWSFEQEGSEGRGWWEALRARERAGLDSVLHLRPTPLARWVRPLPVAPEIEAHIRR